MCAYFLRKIQTYGWITRGFLGFWNIQGIVFVEKWNPSYELRVEIHELRLEIHELRVQIHELRFQIYELRVQIYELRVQNHELED